jgi:hypothetical protein
MSKNNKTTRQVLSSFKGRMELSSPADKAKLESAAAKFFDQLGYYCASLGVPWPTGLELKFPDGTHVSFCRPKSQVQPTEQQKEILRQLVTPMLLAFYESIAPTCTQADREKIKKKMEKYKEGVSERLKGKRSTRAWLIEHEEEIKNLIPEETMERFGDQFDIKSVAKLHEALNDSGCAHKHRPSGKASPNYGFEKGWSAAKARFSQ